MKMRTRALALSIVGLVLLPAPAWADPTTVRASVSTTGGDADGESSRTVISGDGRYIVFHSEANNLVADDRNLPKTDVFRRDLVANTTDIVSVAYDGGPANAPSTFPGVSYDGRYVVFQSEATNIMPGDTTPGADVFRRDMLTGTTERVSISLKGTDPPGLSNRPSISGDGNLVAFNSTADNLVPDDAGGMDVFVRDMAAGVTTNVTPGAAGTAEDDSLRAILSIDGRFVTFVSDLSTLVPDDTNGQRDVFRWERATGQILRASLTHTGGNVLLKSSTRPAISGDGRYVVFQSAAANVVPDDANGTHDVFVRDMVAGTTTRASVTPSGGDAQGASTRIVVNGDGRYVAFASNSRQLVDGDRNKQRDVFLRDMVNGVTTRVSVTATGAEGHCASDSTTTTSGPTAMARPGAPNLSTRPTISADGLVIGFVSGFCNLVPDDLNGVDDIFVRSLR